MVNKALLTAAVFEALDDLRLVAVSATGYTTSTWRPPAPPASR